MSIAGDGLQLLDEVAPEPGSHVYDYYFLLPRAPWFWEGLALNCDPGCCGLDAYEISHAAVRWLCGDDVKLHGRKKRLKKDRPQRQSDAVRLALELRGVASELRSLDESCVKSSTIFDVTATPASHADLCTQLADWLEQPLPA